MITKRNTPSDTFKSETDLNDDSKDQQTALQKRGHMWTCQTVSVGSPSANVKKTLRGLHDLHSPLNQHKLLNHHNKTIIADNKQFKQSSSARLKSSPILQVYSSLADERNPLPARKSLESLTQTNPLKHELTKSDTLAPHPISHQKSTISEQRVSKRQQKLCDLAATKNLPT